jgi:Ca2+-binding EF-hand superfamily protein
VSYTDLIKAFSEAGCVGSAVVTDSPLVLFTKMRTQLSSLGYSVEHAYKQYDSDNHGQVLKNEFKLVSEMIGLAFEEFELDKIFDCIADTQVTNRLEDDVL